MCLNLNSPKKYVLLFISILMICVLSITSFATSTIEELESENEELEVQLDSANSETVTLSEELEGINSDLLVINEELEEINDMIELTEGQVGKTLDKLAEAKAEEDKQYENMKVRIQFMYEAGNTSFLELLLSAESLADFVNKTEFISNVTEYDREMLEELTTIRETIEYEEADLLDGQAALVELQVEAEAKLEELQAKADETETDLDTVLAIIESIEVEQAAIEAEIQAEEEAIAQAEAEAQLEAESSTSNSGGDYSASTSELDLFAAIIDCEAISDYNAMLAVATVIMNRVESSKFPNSINGVVYASGQFAPTWTGVLDRKLATGASSLAYQVAEDALNGKRLDSVSNCYYFNSTSATSRDGVVIGGNVFFVSW